MSPRKRKPKVLRCPICGRTVTAEDAEFPFCSERCRTIDLGKWASGEYRISSPAFDLELPEGAGRNERDEPEDDE